MGLFDLFLIAGSYAIGRSNGQRQAIEQIRAEQTQLEIQELRRQVAELQHMRTIEITNQSQEKPNVMPIIKDSNIYF